MTTEEKQAELEELKADYAQARVALRQILGGAQSYSFDSSQTRQTFTRANLTELRNLMVWLKSEIDRLEGELGLTKPRIFYGRPAY